MIPSNWKARHALSGSRSLHDGDSGLIWAFGDLVGAYYVEATLWPDFRGEEICENAWTLDAIRLDLVRGTISLDDAEVWYHAGLHHLSDIRADRTRRRVE